jgi:hypothetical protein
MGKDKYKVGDYVFAMHILRGGGREVRYGKIHRVENWEGKYWHCKVGHLWFDDRTVLGKTKTEAKKKIERWVERFRESLLDDINEHVRAPE